MGGSIGGRVRGELLGRGTAIVEGLPFDGFTRSNQIVVGGGRNQTKYGHIKRFKSMFK